MLFIVIHLVFCLHDATSLLTNTKTKVDYALLTTFELVDAIFHVLCGGVDSLLPLFWFQWSPITYSPLFSDILLIIVEILTYVSIINIQNPWSSNRMPRIHLHELISCTNMHIFRWFSAHQKLGTPPLYWKSTNPNGETISQWPLVDYLLVIIQQYLL